MSALSVIYGRVSHVRRAWYRQPQRRRHLEQPVVSVGNLVVGGSGKTPTVIAIARILQDLGERPAILSRGYGRQARPRRPLVVVSDGSGPLVPVAESGDEPQMLARALPGVSVVVCADRYIAGRWAATHLGATVHLLDDGFQHVRLSRDVDLLLLSVADLDEQVLPAGRLREPVTAAAAADAVLATGSAADRSRIATSVEKTMFELVPVTSALRRVHPFGEAVSPAGDGVVAVAAIARPERFFASLEASGVALLARLTYRDHHWFSERDIRTIEETARAHGTSLVVTTEKDAVRLEPRLSARAAHDSTVQWAYQPYGVRIEPDAAFRTWLAARVNAARRRVPRPT
ncbi:MAG: tetraacyldisaccharide 4'-kinase [Vicinamibacterales bacterium]